MAPTVLIDRSTLMDPPEFAVAAIHYSGVYDKLWILGRDLAAVQQKCLEVWSKSGFSPDTLKFPEGTTMRERRRIVLDPDAPFFSWVLVDELISRHLMQKVPESRIQNYLDRARQTLEPEMVAQRPSPSWKALFRDESSTLKLLTKSEITLDSEGNISEIILPTKTEAQFLTAVERYKRFMSKLDTRIPYIGAAQMEGWTIHSKDPQLGNWMMKNLPVMLPTQGPPVTLVSEAFKSSPDAFTMGDVLEMIDHRPLLVRLSKVHDAIVESENRKRSRRDILVLALGLASGWAAGIEIGGVSGLSASQTIIDKGTELMVNFASYLFRRKPKK